MALDMTTALTIKANVVGQSQIGGLEKGLGRVTGQTKKTTTAMGRLSAAAGTAVGALRSFLPVLGVAGIAAFAKNNLEAADSMSKLSERTGIAAPTLDKFRQVANLTDTSIESLERAFPALTKNMDMAAQKAKGPAFEAFQRLGVSITDSSGNLRDADAVMLDIADRFNGMSDGAEKAALASTIFGTRIGSELIPLLNSGGDAVRNMSTAMTQEFADRAAAFNDRVTKMGEKLRELGLRLTEALLPVLESLLGIIERLGAAFGVLPQPIQGLVASAVALAGAWAVLGPIIMPLVAAFKGLAALKIGATIAGWAGAIGPLIAGLKALGALIVAIFTGPAGWVVLLVAAGAAIYAFRDQIGDALKAIGKFFADVFKAILGVVKDAAKAYVKFYVKPILKFSENVFDGIVNIFKKLADVLKGPFIALRNVVVNIWNGIIGFVTKVLNAFIQRVNAAIRAANNIPGVNVGQVSEVGGAQAAFANGGVVNGPTLAMVGEGGEREYIVPESKMAKASANYLAGIRGGAVIPAFANGGVVGNMGGGGAANTTVQITTGPVLQQDGQRYVTVGDLERALQDFSSQVFRSSRTHGGRRYQGAY